VLFNRIDDPGLKVAKDVWVVDVVLEPVECVDQPASPRRRSAKMSTKNRLLRHMNVYEIASWRTTISSMENEKDEGVTSSARGMPWAVADDDMAEDSLGRWEGPASL